MKEALEGWIYRKIQLIQTPVGMITVVVGFVIGVVLGRSVL